MDDINPNSRLEVRCDEMTASRVAELQDAVHRYLVSGQNRVLEEPAPPQRKDAVDPVPVRLSTVAGASDLNPFLESSINGFVEFQDDDAVLTPAVADIVRDDGLHLNLRSETVHRLRPAALFTEVVARRLGLTNDCRLVVELAVQEALVNALVHGNLEMGSAAAHTVEALERFHETFDARLSDDRYRHRRIVLNAWTADQRLWVSIRHHGAEFAPDDEREPETETGPESERYVGRGLEMIRTLADSFVHTNDGRRIVMEFAISARSDDTPAAVEPQRGLQPVARETLDLSSCRVLVVDDDEIIRALICETLASMGVLAVETAVDGADGLEKVATFAPDLVVLDIRMPILDGYEVLRQLRADPNTEGLPVLVLSAIDSREDRNRLLVAGGSNLISKPIEPDILSRLVRVHLEHHIVLRDLQMYRQRVEAELETARKMQSELMPSAEELGAIEFKHDCRLAAHYEPSSELGGDLWSAHDLDDHRVGLMLIDFAGHGVGSAINTFRLHAMVTGAHPPGTHPGRHLEALNKRLCSILSPHEFATVLYAVVDFRAETLSYAGAGATNPLIGRADTHGLVIGDGSGLPLGVDSSAQYENHLVPFPRGSYLVLHSDALSEAVDPTGRMFGTAAVAALIRRSAATGSPDAALRNLLGEFRRQVKLPLKDDLSIIWLSY